MFYDRLTKRGEDNALHVFDINDHEIPLSEVKPLDLDLIAGHLVFLEDKIESGELVDRNEYLDRLMTLNYSSSMTDKEIEFFAKHNTDVRILTFNECLRILRDISSPDIVEPFWIGWSEAINLAIKEIAKRIGNVK